MNRNFWEDKKVLITGASGLVGSWLTKILVDAKANVTAIIRDKVPKSYLFQSGYINKVNVVNGCLEDYFTIERTINEYEIDTIFHLGAQTIVGTANRSPLSTFEANIKGSWNLFEVSRNSKLVKRVIFASSDKAYGEHKTLPYDETAALNGTHPYDVSKSCADLLAQAYNKTYKLPIVIARCGNIYGGGDLNFNRIVPGTIKSVIFNEIPIIRSDGKFIRDYFYVLDAVEAYISLAENINEKIYGEAFNFSNEEPIKVTDIVNRILKVMKEKKLHPKILNIASGEIRDQYLSSKKARQVLKWIPKYSLEEGLKETVKWYKDFFKS
jgi:CDP-glucose 4,6-dehydratase